MAWELRPLMWSNNEVLQLTLVKSDVLPVPLAPMTSILNSPTGFFATLSGAPFIRRFVSALRISSLDDRKSLLRRRRR